MVAMIMEKLKTRNTLKNALVAVCFVVCFIYVSYCYTISHSSLTFAFGGGVLLVDIVLYIVIDRLYNKGLLSIDKAFVIILSLLGLIFCFVFTPGIVPDEGYHFFATYRYSNALLFQPFDAQGITMRLEDEDLIHALLTHRLEGQDYFDILNANIFANDSSLTYADRSEGTDLGMNLPQLRLTAAIGVTLGRLLNLGAVLTFYLGRLFNLALFVVLVYFTVRTLPFGKNVMRIVALLPMTLHLAASYSYDSGIIGFAFLLTALCVNAIYGKGKIRKREQLGISVLVFILAPCKIIYFVIALSIFLIPNTRFASTKNALIFKFGIVGIGIISITLIRASALLTMANVNSNGTMLQKGEQQGQVYTLGNILSNPFKFVIMLIKTLFTNGDFYLASLLGGSLGWFQAELVAPSYIIFGLLIIVIISTFPTPEDDSTARLTHRIFFLVFTCMGCFGIFLSLLLDWTFNTSPIIEGVQGRYFLPLLPLALLAIRSKTFICKRNISWALMFGMLLINSVYMIQVFSIALTL